jgi:hypothetical protein
MASISAAIGAAKAMLLASSAAEPKFVDLLIAGSCLRASITVSMSRFYGVSRPGVGLRADSWRYIDIPQAGPSRCAGHMASSSGRWLDLRASQSEVEP